MTPPPADLPQRTAADPERAAAQWRSPGSPFGRLAALGIVAVALGGGGVGAAMANLCVQLAALALIGASRAAFPRFFRGAPRLLVFLVTATAALPLLQLIPLPPEVWTKLPGREIVVQALALTGHAGWFPASVDPAMTLVAVTGLLVPLAAIVAGWSLPRGDLDRMQLLLAGLGLGCALYGAVQVLGGDILIPYDGNPMPGVLFGTFANRNSTGLFLVCCLLMLCSLPQLARSRRHLAAGCGAGLFLALAVLLTQSRTAIVLLALPALLALARTARAVRRGGQAKAFPRGAAPMMAATLLVALALASSGSLDATRIGTSLARFEQGDDLRPRLWEDAAGLADRFWPAGSGMGTFDTVFQSGESLEYLTPKRAGRAHNDYLEIAIEAGLPGLVLAGGWLLWLLTAAIGSARRTAGWQAAGAAGTLLAIALHSLLDYPLRNQTMLFLAAIAIVMLARAASDRRAVAA